MIRPTQIAIVAAFALPLWVSPCPAKEADDPTSTALPNGDLLIGDFEHHDLGRLGSWGWKIEGAFQRSFVETARMMSARVGRHTGMAFASSMPAGSAATGSITSPAFKIERPRIEFMLSGGSRADELSANLIIDGKIIRSASGKDDDFFERVAFDVTEFAGAEARFQVVDRATGIWGHINIDHIVQTAASRTTTLISTAPIPIDLSIGFLRPQTGTPLPGPFTIRDGQFISKDEQPVSFDGALLLSTGSDAVTPASHDALLLKNGERWIGRIAGLEDGKLRLQGGLLNNRTVPLTSIATIEFNASAHRNLATGPREDEPSTLYRKAGEPIPGKLVWIRDKDVAIDCALGVVPIPREGLRRFVIGPVSGGARGDELELRDGTRLRGDARLEGNQLLIKHAILGELPLGMESLLRLRRNPQNLVWLSRRRPVSFESSGPLIEPPRPERIVATGTERWFDALRIHPSSTITYEVPTLGAGNHRLRGTLIASPGNRGRVGITLSCGDAVEKQLMAPGADQSVLDLPLASGQALKLAIEFEGKLAFPCSIDLRDAHIVAVNDAGGNPRTEPETEQN